MIYHYAPIDQLKPLYTDEQDKPHYGIRWTCDEGGLTILKKWVEDQGHTWLYEQKPIEILGLDAGGMCMMNEPSIDVIVDDDKYNVVARHADIFMQYLTNRNVKFGMTYCAMNLPWNSVMLSAYTAQKLRYELMARLPEIERIANEAHTRFTSGVRAIQASGGKVIGENIGKEGEP